MHKHVLIALVLIIFSASVPAHASTLDFSFSFTNLALGHSGTVTGVVRGLMDDTSSPAQSVEITSNTELFGVGEYIGLSFENSWTVSSGAIVAYSFIGGGHDNDSSPGTVNCCLLNLRSQFGNTGLGNDPSTLLLTHPSGFPDITFTPLSSVPLPAALPLFASGLGVMGFFGWRRKRKAAALAA